MPNTLSSNVAVTGQSLIILGRAIGTILGGGLLLLGLAMKDRMKGRRGLLLASWFLVFFLVLLPVGESGFEIHGGVGSSSLCNYWNWSQHILCVSESSNPL